MPKQICEISASSWFYYKEICYDARSHERKISQCNVCAIGQTIRGSNPGRGKYLSPPPKDPDGLWFSTSILKLLRTASYPGVNRPGHAADRSYLSSAEVKTGWSCTPTYRVPPWRVHGRLYDGLVATKLSVMRTKYLDHRQHKSPLYSKLILSSFIVAPCISMIQLFSHTNLCKCIIYY
jgi:hypothetical protein